MCTINRFFILQKKALTCFSLKITLNGKGLYETNSVKYLGIRIDNKLSWKAHINDTALKLIRANAMLYKVRDFVDAGILKSIYHVLFESRIHYACILWGQNACRTNRLFILQKSALRLIHFKERNARFAPLFFKSKVVKLPDKIIFSSAGRYVNNKLLPIFNSWFIFSSSCHNFETSFAAKVHLKIPTVTTATYGKGAFISMTTKTWNNTQSQIKDPMINNFSPNKRKMFVFDFY